MLQLLLLLLLILLNYNLQSYLGDVLRLVVLWATSDGQVLKKVIFVSQTKYLPYFAGNQRDPILHSEEEHQLAGVQGGGQAPGVSGAT